MSVLTNNYEIIRELGRGGMGTVYLAFDKRLDRQVAIKMLHVDPSLDDATTSEIIQRFQKEAKAIAKLNHPNIVSIYDIGEDQQKYYMVIELLEGQSLSNIVEKKQKLSPELVISIGIQICGALSYAHKNGIVHRDIKPANIMFSQEHHAKLTDFGIAQLGNDKVHLTQAGSILGSILYIPPEQLMDSRKVDQRADIYSLGATLYQLFTGRLPFEGNTVAEVITKILNEDIPSMRSFDPTIPEVLDKVIIKALKKEPDDRYAEVGDFGKALREVGEYLKNPGYKIDTSLFDDHPSKTAGTKPEIVTDTMIIPPLVNTGSGINIEKTRPGAKKNLSTQKISTAALNKAVSAKGKSKKNSLSVIIIFVISVVMGLVMLLSKIFNVEKIENLTAPKPAYHQTSPKKIIKARPVRKINPLKIHRPPQVTRPKIMPQKRIEVRRVVPRAVQKPIVRRPAAQVIHKKPAVTTRPATTAKKSIGEGY